MFSLQQMQGPLLGAGPGHAGSAGGAVAGSVVGAVGGPGVIVTATGRAPPGIGSMTGLGGSMQSFLGEAGMYPESTGSGVDSFKDGFSGGNGGGSNGGGAISNSSNRQPQYGTRDPLLVEACKIEPMEEQQHQQQQEEDDKDCYRDSDDEEHELQQHELQQHEGSSGTNSCGVVGGVQRQGSLRGLGRIFGVGTHPVVAEAQARAEAMVHSRGGKSGGSASAAEAAEKKRKRAVLSKEERAKQNRDRNREHARNTRLRKKAFVEELKKQVLNRVG